MDRIWPEIVWGAYLATLGRLAMKYHNYLFGSALALALAACSGGDNTDAAQEEKPAMTAPVEVAEDAAEPAETMAEEAVADEKAAMEEAKAEPKEEVKKEAKKEEAVPAPASAPVEKVAAAEEPAIFKQRCAVCHTANKGGEHKLGPNLYGVYGHKVGQGSFAFSDALKNSGLTLDDATLHAWLENPRKLVPGNRMSFPGLKDAAKRQELIDYLKKQS